MTPAQELGLTVVLVLLVLAGGVMLVFAFIGIFDFFDAVRSCTVFDPQYWDCPR